MYRYSYEGPVMRFDICVATRWTGETMAETEKKARSNLVYKFKKENNLVPQTKVTLPGAIRKEN